MAEQEFDLAAEAKKAVNKRYDMYYEKAKAASDAGKAIWLTMPVRYPVATQ